MKLTMQEPLKDETVPVQSLRSGDIGVVAETDRDVAQGTLVMITSFEAIYFLLTGHQTYPINSGRDSGRDNWHTINNVRVRRLPKGTKLTLEV